MKFAFACTTVPAMLRQNIGGVWVFLPREMD
jgi:hypothetical protein